MDLAIFELIPVVNPDGYIYTMAGGNDENGRAKRWWRKNRRNNGGGDFGVDLNRNWDEQWGTERIGPAPLHQPGPEHDLYPGPNAFSEKETAAVSKWIKDNGKYHGFIDFHSFSQLVLRQYGWKNQAPGAPDGPLQKKVGDDMAAKITAKHMVTYDSKIGGSTLPAPGASDDWAYAKQALVLSYTIELRDKGRHGFALPKAQIIPVGEEAWEGAKYFGTYIVDN